MLLPSVEQTAQAAGRRGGDDCLRPARGARARRRCWRPSARSGPPATPSTGARLLPAGGPGRGAAALSVAARAALVRGGRAGAARRWRRRVRQRPDDEALRLAPSSLAWEPRRSPRRQRRWPGDAGCVVGDDADDGAAALAARSRPPRVRGAHVAARRRPSVAAALAAATDAAPRAGRGPMADDVPRSWPVRGRCRRCSAAAALTRAAPVVGHARRAVAAGVAGARGSPDAGRALGRGAGDRRGAPGAVGRPGRSRSRRRRPTTHARAVATPAGRRRRGQSRLA